MIKINQPALSLTLTIEDAVSIIITSVQLTTVPLRLLVTGLINTLDTNGD